MRAPARLVDNRGVDWLGLSDAGRLVYRSQHLVLTREQVEARFGPARPVEPPPAATAAALTDAVAQLATGPRRHLLAGTLCVALDDVAQNAGRTCPLTAGRPGSNESLAITTMACVIGPDLARDESRWDRWTREVVADVVHGWITGPDRYVEVGENLAFLIGPPVARAGGWRQIADEGLRRGPYADLLSWYLTCRA